jgi:hypothetical protein
MDKWTDGYIGRWIDRQMERWARDRQMNGWTDGLVKRKLPSLYGQPFFKWNEIKVTKI